MDDLSFYAIAFLCKCDKHLANYETSDYLRTVLDYIRSQDAYLKFQNWESSACSWSKAS